MAAVSTARIKAQLLAAPARIDVRRAAVRIIARQLRCSASDAEYRLHALKGSAEIDRVFKRVLPDIHRRAHKSIFERRRQFFQAIDDRFPVDWDYLDEEYGNIETDGISYFDLGILPRSMRPFHSYEYRSRWEKLPLAYQLADVLFKPDARSSNEYDERWAHLAKTYRLAEGIKPTGTAPGGLLFMLFEGHRSPLKHLPLAVQVLSYNTGCLFFDFDEEDGTEGYEWSQSSVEYLSEQGKRGKLIEKNTGRLNKWLKASPSSRIEKACRLYRKLQRLVNDEKSSYRIRVEAASSGRALIDVL